MGQERDLVVLWPFDNYTESRRGPESLANQLLWQGFISCQRMKESSKAELQLGVRGLAALASRVGTGTLVHHCGVLQAPACSWGWDLKYPSEVLWASEILPSLGKHFQALGSLAGAKASIDYVPCGGSVGIRIPNERGHWSSQKDANQTSAKPNANPRQFNYVWRKQPRGE